MKNMIDLSYVSGGSECSLLIEIDALTSNQDLTKYASIMSVASNTEESSLKSSLIDARDFCDQSGKHMLVIFNINTQGTPQLIFDSFSPFAFENESSA